MVAECLFELCVEKKRGMSQQLTDSLEFYLTACQLDSPPYNWICLASFDCIEKALKAAMFNHDPHLRVLNGKDILKTHHIDEYIEYLIGKGKSEFKEFKEKVKAVKQVCYTARWPNQHPYGTPGDHFDETKARELINLAHSILYTVKEMIFNIDFPPLQ